MRVVVETRIKSSPRVEQVRGQFDLPEESYSRVAWADVPSIPGEGWNVGLITGPSGSGKSTVARAMFPPDLTLWGDALPAWPESASVVDGFPPEMPASEVTALLCSVGFSSPPAWLRPYKVLSTGERFRVDLARLLAAANGESVHVFDEFTSTVDRTVAQVGSAAVAKAIRKRGLKFVAVTCHSDVIDWLQPDWVYTPSDGQVAWRSLQPRPAVELEVYRTTAAAWGLFRRHHYLSHALNRTAACFVALERKTQRPVAFSAWIAQLTKLGGKREHRTVVLPDWQGIGIGMRLSSLIASLWKGLGQRAVSSTTHPGFVAARLRSPDWRMIRRPAFGGKTWSNPAPGRNAVHHASTRLSAGFEYVGPPMKLLDAQRLIG